MESDFDLLWWGSIKFMLEINMQLFIKVKTKAREEKIERIDSTHFLVHIKEVPERGKANRAVINSISAFFKIPIARVILVSGFRSHQKVISVLKLS